MQPNFLHNGRRYYNLWEHLTGEINWNLSLEMRKFSEREKREQVREAFHARGRYTCKGRERECCNFLACVLKDTYCARRRFIKDMRDGRRRVSIIFPWVQISAHGSFYSPATSLHLLWILLSSVSFETCDVTRSQTFVSNPFRAVNWLKINSLRFFYWFMLLFLVHEMWNTDIYLKIPSKTNNWNNWINNYNNWINSYR